MTTTGPYSHIERNAQERPNEIAVINGPMKISFAKLQDMTARLGTAMRLDGVRPGSVVLIKAGMPIWDYLFAIACMHEGAIAAVQIGPKYNPAIAADIAFGAFPIEGFPESKTVKVDAAWLKSSETLDPLPAMSYETSNPVIRLIQTSGTTGAPKVLEYDFDSFVSFAAEISGDNFERTFCMLPFSILAGSIVGYLCISEGKTYYLPTGNKVEDIKMFASYDFEVITGSPTMIADIFFDDSIDQLLSRVTTIRTGGAAMPRELVQRIRAKSNARITNRMGSSEASRVAGRDVALVDEPNLVGQIFEEVEVRIVDSNFNDLPAGEIGRIGVRSPNMRSGYRNNPEATAKHFVDGFFYSGDEGYVSAEGLLYLVGREDERINSGGVKSDPANLDATMRDISGVIDAAVFGFDRPTGIRGLAAVLVLDSKAQMVDVVPQIEKALGTKKPQFFIQVMQIPRNLMGKVERIKLEALHASDLKKLIGKS